MFIKMQPTTVEIIQVYAKPLSAVGEVSVKWTYPTPDSGWTHLFNGRGRSVVQPTLSSFGNTSVHPWSYIPLVHSRHNGRDGQYRSATVE